MTIINKNSLFKRHTSFIEWT